MHGSQYETQIDNFAHIFKSEANEGIATMQLSTYDNGSAYTREVIQAMNNLDTMNLVAMEDWIYSDVSPAHHAIGSAFDDVNEFVMPALFSDADGKICHSQLHFRQFSPDTDSQAISALLQLNNIADISLADEYYDDDQQAQNHIFPPWSATRPDYD